jgi:hypothetical protein
MYPLVQIGPFALSSGGLVLLISIIIGGWLLSRVARARGGAKLARQADNCFYRVLIALATYLSQRDRSSRIWRIARGRGFTVKLGAMTLYLHTTSLASGLLLIAMPAAGDRPAHDTEPLGCTVAPHTVGAQPGR